MCGICGFSGDKPKLLDQHALRSMLRVMHHRGPDSEGVYYKNGAGLGIKRLSIVDLRGGHQPIHNEKKTVWMVFNGEIYNYQELSRRLSAKGHTFYTRSDGEVIVHLYEEYGEEFVHYLNGMFAIAIYDERENKLVLARDRLGIKPLYYTVISNTLIFASEIKSLLRCPIIDTELNHDKLATYLLFRYVPGEQTLFKNIFKLMPGHLLVHKSNQVSLKKYWEINFPHQYQEKADHYYTERLAHLIEESVKYRLIAEVPVGIFISGGLDSTIILAQAAELYPGQLKTFSTAFKKPKAKTKSNEFDELEYARKAAQYYGSEHHEVVVDPEAVIDELEKIVWFLDEPLSDPTAIPLYYISKYAKNHVKVALSGEGADEIFAGYAVYKEPYAVNRYNSLPKCIRKGLIEPLVLSMPINFGKNFIRRAELPISKRYKGVGMTFNESELPQILDENLHASILNLRNALDTYAMDCRCEDEINQMLYLDQKTWLVEDALLKVDRMSMSNSIELRVPFLDHRLVEFAASIPSKLKFRGGSEKYILKQTYRQELPDFSWKRKKNEFPVPISSLIKNEYRTFACDLLLSSRALGRGYFNRSYIEALLSGKYRSARVGRQIWLLLVFELWHRVFLDDNGYKAKNLNDCELSMCR
ncbi:asparagine synthase (glutamine-hydrolyzing) [Desulfothermobacter acidiphilus]|uniref:asparagine synthase (glutamine-hydrolyzing) n=1 Tax=Desulfothermobacter acidiphilus TaxID=1938353 RepID=UPI003F8B1E6D